MVETFPARKREPSVNGTPACSTMRFFSRYGTPAKRPAGRLAARASAASYEVKITALRAGFNASIREIAASISSVALTTPCRTRSAWATASSRAKSLTPLWRENSSRGRETTTREPLATPSETYVHLDFLRSAQVATCADRQQAT
jgi:hypothetical protein